MPRSPCFGNLQTLPEPLPASGSDGFRRLVAANQYPVPDHPAVLEKYRNFFRYVLVDEYQDTNNSQYLLINLLAQANRNLCVVGDDDQSIYKFRGANIGNILNFEDDYSDVQKITLDQNYRSNAKYP